MQLGLSVIVILCAVFPALVCGAEEHLVPKYGDELKHNHRKRDLSASDAECILKALLSKLKHNKDSGLLQKEYITSKDHHFHGSEMMSKPHLARMESEEIGCMGKSAPLEHGYKESHIPHEDSYRMKKDTVEKDMMALLKKIKELTSIKVSEDMNKKNYRMPEDKLLSRTVHSEPFSMKKMSEKIMADDTYRVSDTDVLLAESLHHLKIAGDIEAYPEIKMAPLYEKKLADEKILAEKDLPLAEMNSDESYMEKVDEFGKSLFKEETYPHMKDGSIGEYLKKEEKDIKMEETAEKKVLDSWISGDKELFPVEKGLIMEEKFKHEDPHHMEGHISHGMSDELLKKLKISLGMDKALGTEDDLLLKGLHAEEIEITDEMLKKFKILLENEKELGEEHEELVHLLKELHKEEAEGSIAYEKAKEQIHKDANIGLNGEKVKKDIEATLAFGAKDMHGTELFEKGLSAEKSHGVGAKDIHGTDLFFGKGLSAEKAHGMGSKAVHGTDLFFEKGLSAEKAHGIDGKIGVGIEKAMHGEEAMKGKDMYALGKAFDIEKAHGIDSKIGIGIEKAMHGEEAMKGKEMHGMGKAFDIEKALGIDSKIGFDIAKSMHGEEAMKGKEMHGIGKAFDIEKAHGIDSKIGFDIAKSMHGEEAMKGKEMHGMGKAFDTEKAHGIDSKIGFDIAKSMHGEEAMKAKEIHGLGKAFDIEKEKAMRGGKAAIGEGFKHSIGHEISISTGADKAFKVPEEEFFRKEKAYGTDVFFHGDKEMAGGHHIHHVLKDEKDHVLHDSADKHHLEGAVEAGERRKMFHDLKAKLSELLARFLRSKKCHLVTMRPREFLGIVNCISKSKDPILCEKFSICEKKMPLRVIKALEKCQQETIPGEIKKCNPYTPLYPSTEIPLKIFKCIALEVKELAFEEKKPMIDFEECARIIKAESCGRFKWFRRPHKGQ